MRQSIRSKPDIQLPAELNDLILREADCVYRVVGSSISALVNNDMSIVCGLSDQDEPVHQIYEEFFRTYNRMSAPELSDDSSYDDLRRTIMVSRYLDRTASISIDAAWPSDLPAYRVSV